MKAAVKVRQVSVSLWWCLQTDWEISVMAGHPPCSNEGLKIQPSGDEVQQRMELSMWLGWKCELKLIHLLTKLLSEVLFAVFLCCARSVFWSYHNVKRVDGKVVVYFPCCLCLHSMSEDRSHLTFIFCDVVQSQVVLPKGFMLASLMRQPELYEEVCCFLPPITPNTRSGHQKKGFSVGTFWWPCCFWLQVSLNECVMMGVPEGPCSVAGTPCQSKRTAWGEGPPEMKCYGLIITPIRHYPALLKGEGCRRVRSEAEPGKKVVGKVFFSLVLPMTVIGVPIFEFDATITRCIHYSHRWWLSPEQGYRK